MAVTIKTLIDKNKSAYDAKFFIESLSLSYTLINKALKQIVKDEFDIELIDQKIKTADLVSQLKKELDTHPTLKSKVSKYCFEKSRVRGMRALKLSCICPIFKRIIWLKVNK